MSAAQEDAAIVAAMVRDFDFPRYAAALFAAPDKRRAMLALAAFDLEIQRIPDQVSQPLPGEVRLQWWSDALEGTEHGGVAGHPVAAELLHAIETYALSRAPLLSLIEAHKFGLYDDAMPTLAALEIYCDDVCGSLIDMNADLLSRDAAAADASRDAGRALGLARILIRLAHDAAHKRCFLPADILAAYGVTRHQVLVGEDTAEVRKVRDGLISDVRNHLKRVRTALKPMSRAVRPAFLPLATLSRELNALEKLPPFALTPPPSRLQVLTLQWWMMR